MEVRTLEADIVTFLLCEIIADSQSMEVVMTRCPAKEDECSHCLEPGCCVRR